MGESGEPTLLKIGNNEYYEGSKKAMIERGCMIMREFKAISPERLGEYEEGARNSMRKKREKKESELAAAVA